MILKLKKIFATLMVASVAGCQNMPSRPIDTAGAVDIPRFMGRWYVIAAIPTWIEREAYNAVETYTQQADGRIATEFQFRKGGFEGPLKTYHPNARVLDETGVVWGMQFVWPFRADYRIVHVSEDYQFTIIGREKRDYAWIMARTPQISADKLAMLKDKLAGQGYALDALRVVPQRWPDS